MWQMTTMWQYAVRGGAILRDARVNEYKKDGLFLYTNQLVSKIVLLEAWKHSDH